MTPARQLIVDLQAMNARLEVKQGKIALDAPTGIVTPDILRRLKKLKSKIIAELKQLAPVCDTAPCPADLAERVAILEIDGGQDRRDVERLVALEFGFPSPDDLHRAIVADWQRSLAVDALYADDRQHLELLASLIAFCDGWGLLAAQRGWDAVALFGIDPHVPTPDRQRRDRHGIAVQLAVSKLPGLRLVDLANDFALFNTATKAKLKAQRFHPARDQAVPIWESLVRENLQTNAKLRSVNEFSPEN